jgi:hypothetical protein
MIKKMDCAGLVSDIYKDSSVFFHYKTSKTSMFEECGVNIFCIVITAAEVHNQIMIVADIE